MSEINLLHLAPEIKNALQNNQPILALESTIISHGMPYPQNVEMALELEAIAREYGVIPATIAIMNGRIKIGLSKDEIHELGQSKNARKLSRADLADCVLQKQTGATTVAATMILAQKAGIKVFATGGIGGVHQGAETSFDISADLQELAQTRMIVVCAGAKAILDLPKTYEMLETLGVPVYAYQSDQIPAFYSQDSGLKAPLRADDPHQISKAFSLQCALDLPASLLINNPIPKTNEIAKETILPIIEQALQKAQNDKISAKDVTPFLLDALYHATNGLSLNANQALVRNNVHLGAKIALELARKPVK